MNKEIRDLQRRLLAYYQSGEGGTWGEIAKRIKKLRKYSGTKLSADFIGRFARNDKKAQSPTYAAVMKIKLFLEDK